MSESPNGRINGNGTNASPRTNHRLLSENTNVDVDPAEEKLLAGLEELAQKVEVITKWADELYESIRDTPQSKPVEYHLEHS